MTEQNNETTESTETDDVSQTDATTEGVVSNATPEPDEQNEPEQGNDKNPNAEAAKRRHQLRETQQLLEESRAWADSLIKQTVELIAQRDAGVNASTLWKLGYKPADFLAEDGINAEHIAGVAAQAAEEHGLRFETEKVMENPAQLAMALTVDDDDGPSWSDALTGNR